MGKLNAITSLWVATSLVVSATAAQAQDAPIDSDDQSTGPPRATDCTFEGTWDSTFGELVVEVDGDSARGHYAYGDGRVEAHIRGDTLLGTWSEPPSGDGDVELVLAADCQTFEGRWRYGTTGEFSAWNGTRLSSAQGPMDLSADDRGPQESAGSPGPESSLDPLASDDTSQGGAAPTDVIAPVSTPDVEAISSSGRWMSTLFGHGLSWDAARWKVSDVGSDSSGDWISLASDGITVEIAALVDNDGDPRRCLSETVGADIESAGAFDAAPDIALPEAPDDASRSGAGAYLIASAQDEPPRLLARYVECRPLVHRWATLRTVATAPSSDWLIAGERVAALLGAVEMPAWAMEPVVDATIESIGVGSTDLPGAFGCAHLITQEERDDALGIWDRVRADLPANTRLNTGHSTCREVVDGDERVFVTIEPGDPEDFDPQAEMLGSTGHRLPGIGDDARLFRDVDAGGLDGRSLLSVRQSRDVGELFFRVTLGRPDLDSPARTLHLARLARAALERFPGVPVAEVSAESPGYDAPSPRIDPARLSFVDNLLAKEAASEWSRADGVIATLRMLAGEALAEDVLRYEEVMEAEGTGIIDLASRYVSQNPGDRASAEIERLLDVLLFSTEELESMAGIGDATTRSARGNSAGLIVASVNRGSLSPALMPLPSQASIRSAQQPIEYDCGQFFYEDKWKGAAGVGPCLEWRPANVPGPGLEEDKYRVFYPAPSFPQAGWTKEHYDLALTALEHSARWFEGEGSRLARAAGTFGLMPNVNLVFAVSDTDALAYANAVLGRDCGVRLNPKLQKEPAGRFEQTIAHELAHCFEADNFPDDQLRMRGGRWWVEGGAVYISNLVYPTYNYEWKRLSWTRGISNELPLLELAYGAWLFLQFLEGERGKEAVFELASRLPMTHDRSAEEASLRAYPGMEKLFHDFVEDTIDGSIRDSGGGKIPSSLEISEKPLTGQESIPVALKPFGVARAKLVVEKCKEVDLLVPKADVLDSARPSSQDGWLGLPFTLPSRPGDERDRIHVLTAVERADTTVEVSDPRDDEGDPDCVDEQPAEEPTVTSAVPPCTEICEASPFFRDPILYFGKD